MHEKMHEKRPLLVIDGLCAGYGGKAVLNGLSLMAQEGELVALLGLNGSGKSTLLRAAQGFIPAYSGSVTIDGENVFAMNERERAMRIGYIPQRIRTDDGMTVIDAVLMGANARTPLFGSYTRAQRMQAEECLAQLGIGELGMRMMGTLSQGQRQMAVFARAMMQQPQVFLLDEPDSALDLPKRRDMMGRVRDMVRGGRRSALLVVHDASLALSLSDRVLILKDGRIACALDMRKADEEEVQRAMRLLYGKVNTAHIKGGWAVLA